MLVSGSRRNELYVYGTFRGCFLPSFGSFGQTVSEEKIFFNRPIRNKNYQWQPCLPMDRNKISNLYRGPSIDAYYQVAVYLAKGFQRRRVKCEKLTDDRPRTPSHGKSSLCLRQCELKCKVLSKSLCLIWQYIKQYFLFYILGSISHFVKKIVHVHCLYYLLIFNLNEVIFLMDCHCWLNV